MTSAGRLYQLQTLDSRLVWLEKSLASLDDGGALRAQVDQARADEETAQAELHEKQARLRSMELELQSTAGKAQKMEQDLYSGRVANPKELAAMQQDVQVLGRQRERIEEEMLALMEETEHLLEDIRTREAQRQARERALDEHLEDYRSRTKALDAELESVRRQREASAVDVGEDLLRRYERLRGRKEGVAVAAVTGGICEGCHVAIPEGRVVELIEEDRILTCEGCGRILYARP